MKMGVVLLPLLLIPSIGGCTQPADMYQGATVRITESHACFSVANTEEARRTPPTIAAISVVKYADADWKWIWSWSTPLTPETMLHPEECIPYGYRPAGDPPDHVPEPLRPGERYHVAINAEIPNPSTSGDRMLGRMYSLDFCLRDTTGSEPEIIVVPRSRGETQWQLCESGLTQPEP